MEIVLVSAPYDSGHYKKRSGAGPLVLARAVEQQCLGNGYTVRREEVFVDTAFSTEATTGFEVSRQISEQVWVARERGAFPIVFSGNCNAAAIGSLSGLRGADGVIWFDCHGDFNTPETTIGGFLDGMALSMVAGQCWGQLLASVPGYRPIEENNILLIGARDLDPLEEERLMSSRIKMISPQQLRQDINVLAEKAMAVREVYIHVDMDVIEPSIVKANIYSTPGGLLPDELCQAIAVIKNTYTIAALGFSSYDPSFDQDEKMPVIVNSIVKSVLG